MRSFVALEPRFYRETIGCVIRELRPRLKVTILEPEMIGSEEEEVARLGPDSIVLCSHRSPATFVGGPAWIEYCPYTEPKATICLAGERWKLEVVELVDLLWVIDQVESLAQSKWQRLAAPSCPGPAEKREGA